MANDAATALNGFLGRPRRALALADRKLRAEAANVAGSHVVKILEFFAEVYQDRQRPDFVRMAAADRLLDRALGRPTSSSAFLDADDREANIKHIYEVRWMPPDPADRSQAHPEDAPTAKVMEHRGKADDFGDDDF